MAYRGQGQKVQKVQKVMVQPINLIFRYLQIRSRIQVWLYEQVNMRIEGCIIGFDGVHVNGCCLSGGKWTAYIKI
uniref:Small nuclear ribonucleoprotein E n=1 Tax=Monodon monoceros TaxID=40151 RepID=A0A8C6F8S7_MONMO